MKRDITFKAKSLDSGEWVKGDLVHYVANTCIRVERVTHSAPIAKLDYIDIEVDPATVCQFTGLLDSKGGMIFEGDKVLYGDLTGESGHAIIKHWAGGFIFEWGKNNFRKPKLITSAIYMACPSELTITENIHDSEDTK